MTRSRKDTLKTDPDRIWSRLTRTRPAWGPVDRARDRLVRFGPSLGPGWDRATEVTNRTPSRLAPVQEPVGAGLTRRGGRLDRA